MKRFYTRLVAAVAAGALGAMALAGMPTTASASGGGMPEPPMESKFCNQQGPKGPVMGLAISGIGHESKAECETNATAKSGDTGHNNSNAGAFGGDGTAIAKGDARSGNTGDANTNVNGQSGDTGNATNQQSANSAAVGGNGGDSGDVSGSSCCDKEDKGPPAKEPNQVPSLLTWLNPPSDNNCGCDDGTQTGDGGDGGNADSEAKTEGDATSGDSKVEQDTTGGQSGNSGNAEANPNATGTGGDATSSSNVTSGDSGPAFSIAIAPFGDANAYSSSGDTGGNSSNSFAKGGDGYAYADGDAESGNTGDANTNVNGQSGDTGDASNQQSANSAAFGGNGGDSGDVSSCGCDKPDKHHEQPYKGDVDGKSFGEHNSNDECGCVAGSQTGDGGDGGNADSEAKTEGDATSGDSKVEQDTTGGQSGNSGNAEANPTANGTGGDATATSDVTSGDSGKAGALVLPISLGGIW